ncbi:MAG: hypothetical protein JRI47_06280, partial [Deltaproteobacteria bacterium]|nr:hypothetical protein [Deltaproteobacteria bacterium]
VDIVDRWHEGSLDEMSKTLDYFKVRVEDGSTYVIRYNQLFDSWAVLVPPQTTTAKP